MKAKTRYNDYVGTAAADFADLEAKCFSFLEDCLQKRGVDTDRYEPIGVKFWTEYNDIFCVYFICIDHQREEKKAVSIGFEKGISKEEFFDLFKSFEVILTQNHGSVDYSTWDLDEEPIMIDDRKSETN